jgi:hypothetical protein
VLYKTKDQASAKKDIKDNNQKWKKMTRLKRIGHLLLLPKATMIKKKKRLA